MCSSDLVADAVTAISPLFGVLAEALDAVAPAIVVLGPIMQSLAPVFAIVSQLLSMTIKRLQPVLDLVLYVLIGVGIGLSWFVKELGNLWNATVDALSNGFQQYMSALTAGLPPGMRETFEAITKKLVENIGLQKVDTSAAEKAMNDLIAMGGDLNKLKHTPAEVADDLGKLGAAAEAVTEAFLNVPTGYKVAAARFAVDASGVTQFAMPGNAGAGSGVTINGDITIVTNNPDELWQRLLRQEFRVTGAYSASAARAAKGMW